MTWAEFKLRLIAFNRAEEREEYKLRRLSWITYIAPHQDPKKLRGLREDKWWKIGKNDTQKVSQEHKDRFLEEYKKYLAKKNGTA